MTSDEYLKELASRGDGSLQAWFDAEHVDDLGQIADMSQKSADCVRNDGKMSETGVSANDVDANDENATCNNSGENVTDDSREKLEADVWKRYTHTFSTAMWPPSANKHTDMVSVSIDTVLGWLDRQAAITERETTKRHELFCETCEAESDKRIAELRAELEKATNNLNSANKDFENARAELVAECDELKELNEYHALQYELASEDADRLQAQVDGLQSKLAEYEDRSMQYVSLTGGKLYTGTKALTERIAELTAELDAAKQQISQFDAPKSVETPENPASKCEISDFDDSRELLEADIRKYANPEGNTGTLGACWERKMFEFIDRQAAITDRETKLHELYKFEENHREHIRSLEETNRKLNERIAELQKQVDSLTVRAVAAEQEAEELTAIADRLAHDRDELQSAYDELTRIAAELCRACGFSMIDASGEVV